VSAVAKRVDVLRPSKPGLQQALTDFMLSHLDVIFRILRVVRPILRLPFVGVVVVTRNDDVREVLLNNVDFHVEQAQRLNVLMDNAPFMLGLDDRAVFERNVAPLREAVKPQDIKDLAQRCRERAAELVAGADGRLEVVDFIRQVTLDVFSAYVGVTAPEGHDLRIMATRMYEFQVSPGKDPALAEEAAAQAKALRDHIDQLIAGARARGPGNDNILGRLLIHQNERKGPLEDAELRANLIGLIVGALPQLPIAAPQALDQLLARPRELELAAASARSGNDVTLARYVFEASRFDPLAPFLLRRCFLAREIASGASRHNTIKKGELVAAALLSAMKDPRRVVDPEVFDPSRGWATYLHFGLGLHTCFFEHINPVVLPAMLKPLLACDGLARAPGRRGRLTKRGIFTDQLWVTFTPPA